MKDHPQDIYSDSISFSKEELHALVLNNLDDIFLLVGKNLKILHINEVTRKKIHDLFGIHTTSQTNVLELAPPDRHQALLKIYEEVFNGKEIKTEIEIPANGDVNYFENHFIPAKNHIGEIVGALVSTRDISQKKKAEKHLREIEERWRFALEGAKQGVWDWDMKNNNVFFSNSYKRLYGYEEHELDGKIEEWEAMVHPDDRKKMAAAIQKHTSGNDPYYEGTYRIRAKDGSYKWILDRGMILGYDDHGKPVRMIGTHTDISEQIAGEETYKALFYNNPLPMWTYDKNTTRFLSVNEIAIDHYGYSKEEFLSMNIMDIWPQEEVDSLNEVLNRRKETQHLTSLCRHRKKNGELLYAEVSTHNLNNSDSILVVSQDITSKLVTENQLKQSNERFSFASRATSDAIWDWNLLTNELHWGESIQALFGFHPHEVSISIWESLIHPDDRYKVQNSILGTIEHSSQSNWKEEYRFAKADGTFSYVLDRGFIIRDATGKAVRMIGSMQDITDRKYKEQVLSLERRIFVLSSDPDINLHFIVQSLLKGLEEIHEDAYTSVLLLKDDDIVESFAAPRLPDAYYEKLNGIKIGPNDGSCGAAMWRKQTVIVSDIDNDPLWENYKHLTQLFQLKACWSLPIIHSSGKVMGSFAIYYKTVKSPSSNEVNTFDRIRNILRILMEHHWSLNEIKIANERFDAIMRATHDLIWDWDLETNFIYRDESGLQKVYGVKSNKAIENTSQWLTRIHPEDMERVQKVISEILQATHQDTFEIEYRFQKDDSNYAYVYDRGKILRNAQGKPVRMIGAAQDITERKRLEQELLHHELERQKAINQATVDSQEQERTEIGKELHDNVNQVLTTTKLYLDLALSNADLKDELIEKSNKNILRVINEIRQLSRSLMDPLIEDLGMIDSILDLTENINLTRKLHVTLKTDRKIELLLDKNHKLTIFRIIQEALNNSIRHAKAAHVLITLRYWRNDAELIIEDDGIGFDPSLVKKGAGLKNIQNRAYLINGTYAVESASKKGCKIIITFPIIND